MVIRQPDGVTVKETEIELRSSQGEHVEERGSGQESQGCGIEVEVGLGRRHMASAGETVDPR